MKVKKKEETKKTIKKEETPKVEEKVETKKQKEIRIQIKQRTFDAETKSQFSNWVSGKSFPVIAETETTYTFANEAKIKLGVVKKEDCIVIE